jgi:hypothetical protein
LKIRVLFCPIREMVTRPPSPGTEDGVGEKEARPHPGLLPQEKESLFPRLVNLSALGLRWFMGSMREFFGEFSPVSSPSEAQATTIICHWFPSQVYTHLAPARRRSILFQFAKTGAIRVKAVSSFFPQPGWGTKAD